MKEMVESVKSLLPLLALVAVLGGFYYTTQHRLGELETKMEGLAIEISGLNDTLEDVLASVERLSKKANKKRKENLK